MKKSNSEPSREKNANANQAGLKREIGLLALVALGVGSIIGSGMFAMPAVMGSLAGPAPILAVILTGIITTFLAITYAELGSTFPRTGGPYSLPQLALGDFGGFVLGWGYFLYAFIGTAAIIDIFITYLGFNAPGGARALMPYDMLVVTIFAILIFAWAYFANTQTTKATATKKVI